MSFSLSLSLWQLALSGLLIGAQVLLSVLFQLGLIKQVLWAALRMTVQLSLIGFILTWIFAQQSLVSILLLMGVMTVLAGQTSVSRVKRHYKGIYTDAIISIFLSAWLTTSYFIAVVNRPEPWYHPQYLIPLLGLVLGNGISGVALGLKHFLENVEAQQAHIEMSLSLGASRWEACRHVVQEAIRTGLIPILNAMLASGLVSLPGMMTGQILGGVPPEQAVRYQIVVMLMISTSTALGTSGTVFLAYRRIMTPDHRVDIGILSGGKHAENP